MPQQVWELHRNLHPGGILKVWPTATLLPVVQHDQFVSCVVADQEEMVQGKLEELVGLVHAVIMDEGLVRVVGDEESLCLGRIDEDDGISSVDGCPKP